MPRLDSDFRRRTFFISSMLIKGAAIKPRSSNFFCVAIPAIPALMECPPQHGLWIVFSISGDELMMRVGLATSPTPWSSFAVIPKLHMFILTLSMPYFKMNCCNSRIFHAMDPVGCS